MQARVVIIGPTGGMEPLTYLVPPEMEQRVTCGHRVIVPLRSRKLTGVVVEVGANLDAGGRQLKPLLEILEPRPLFDRAHLDLFAFLSSYYMAPLAEAYRSVIPAAARIESRRMYKIATIPGLLAAAAFTPIERTLVEALVQRRMSARQLERLGEPREVASALARLAAGGFLARVDSTRGRHRQPGEAQFARLKDGARLARVRGSKQRSLIEALSAAAGGIPVEELEARIPGARGVLGPMVRRGLVELKSRSSIAATDAGSADELNLGGKSAEVRGPFPTGQSRESGTGGIELNEEQAIVVRAIAPAVRQKRFEVFLLWGVTGSGKTEIYLQLAAQALETGLQVLILVPEIAMADQLVKSFRARFGPLVAVAHSGQNVAERWASWMAAVEGRARIIIGPRSVVFAPIHKLGLIVVDEEHDPAYKQEEGIRYHARDLAVALARFSGCPAVLGSATPSVESFANARRGRYRLLRLYRRVMERPMAEVEVIDLRQEARNARDTQHRSADRPGRLEGGPPLSAALAEALKANLAAGGQSIVFLNRRGYHNFLQCHLCGVVIACSDCSVSLTFHMRDRSLRCHYCGRRVNAPEKCPECGGFGLEGQGFGTERLAAALSEALPNARIERMDSDTSGRKGARLKLLEALACREIDVLVGTQMITKGFDFPAVTLVGVVLADLALNLPDFRSAERTFQLLTQVAGRAGRGERPGRVLIQTYAPHHYAIRAASEQDYTRFVRRELQLRRELMYPPFARMALVRLEGAESRQVSAIASKAAAALGRLAEGGAMRVLGPAPAPIERIRRRYRWQVVVKSNMVKEMHKALAAMRTELGPLAQRDGVHLGIDIDPVNML